MNEAFRELSQKKRGANGSLLRNGSENIKEGFRRANHEVLGN